MRVPLVARAVDDVFPLSLQVFKCEESMPSLPLHNSAPSDECRVDKNALVPPLPLLLQKISLFHIDNETMFLLAFFLFIGCRFRPILRLLKGVSKSLPSLEICRRPSASATTSEREFVHRLGMRFSEKTAHSSIVGEAKFCTADFFSGV